MIATVEGGGGRRADGNDGRWAIIVSCAPGIYVNAAIKITDIEVVIVRGVEEGRGVLEYMSSIDTATR